MRKTWERIFHAHFCVSHVSACWHTSPFYVTHDGYLSNLSNLMRWDDKLRWNIMVWNGYNFNPDSRGSRLLLVDQSDDIWLMMLMLMIKGRRRKMMQMMMRMMMRMMMELMMYACHRLGLCDDNWHFPIFLTQRSFLANHLSELQNEFVNSFG